MMPFYNSAPSEPAVTVHLVSQHINRSLALPVDGKPVYIKRSSRNGSRLVPSPTNAYFDCQVMSRNHAELSRSGKGPVMLTDTSRHGTYINGCRVGFNKRLELKSGDVVKFGDSVTKAPGPGEGTVEGVVATVTIEKPSRFQDHPPHSVRPLHGTRPLAGSNTFTMPYSDDDITPADDNQDANGKLRNSGLSSQDPIDLDDEDTLSGVHDGQASAMHARPLDAFDFDSFLDAASGKAPSSSYHEGSEQEHGEDDDDQDIGSDLDDDTPVDLTTPSPASEIDVCKIHEKSSPELGDADSSYVSIPPSLPVLKGSDVISQPIHGSVAAPSPTQFGSQDRPQSPASTLASAPALAEAGTAKPAPLPAVSLPPISQLDKTLSRFGLPNPVYDLLNPVHEPCDSGYGPQRLYSSYNFEDTPWFHRVVGPSDHSVRNSCEDNTTCSPPVSEPSLSVVTQDPAEKLVSTSETDHEPQTANDNTIVLDEQANAPADSSASLTEEVAASQTKTLKRKRSEIDITVPEINAPESPEQLKAGRQDLRSRPCSTYDRIRARPKKRSRTSSTSLALTAVAGAVGGAMATLSFLWGPLGERLLESTV